MENKAVVISKDAIVDYINRSNKEAKQPLKHTAGEWNHCINSSSISIYSEKHDCDLATISLTHKGYENDEAEANAKLIEAAPEFLKFAEWVINEIDSTPDELNDALLGLIKITAHRLIQKATR